MKALVLVFVLADEQAISKYEKVFKEVSWGDLFGKDGGGIGEWKGLDLIQVNGGPGDRGGRVGGMVGGGGGPRSQWRGSRGTRGGCVRLPRDPGGIQVWPLTQFQF